MDANYIYWFTRIGVLHAIFTLFIVPAFLYMFCYGVFRLISFLESDAMPEAFKKLFTAKRAILSAVAFALLVIASEMVPSKQDLRMMLAVDLATNHGIKVLVEK